MISTHANDIEEQHLIWVNVEQSKITDGCAEDLEFYVIWIDF